MELEVKSIADQIDCLARLTGAPRSFVDQVRDLFTRKGISLDEDSTPYLAALEEAFIREESIRAGSTMLPAAVRAGAGQDPQVVRRRRSRRRPGRDGAALEPTTRLSTSGPMLVTRRQHEEAPLVPGPEELQ
jgi:hypothetical protein